MFHDADIKIAGDKPSLDIERNKKIQAERDSEYSKHYHNARTLGEVVALKFIDDAKEFTKNSDSDNFDLMIQRRLLLSFTATIGFEQFCLNDTVCGIAQKSFIDTIKSRDSELYKTSGDTGAFSFYYLAYRRGSEIERRIGQTFAMLCSHDGDPIYQELGEALYCWFISVVKKAAEELGLLNN